MGVERSVKPNTSALLIHRYCGKSYLEETRAKEMIPEPFTGRAPGCFVSQDREWEASGRAMLSRRSSIAKRALPVFV